MTIAERFQDAWTEVGSTGDAGPELLPVRLARACLRVIPASGAGISVMNGLRVPIGASDHASALAERVQSTTGEGPCLLAHSSRRPVLATEKVIAQTWPAFHGELVRQTPFRSAASVPLSIGSANLGELDFYYERPDDVTGLSLRDAGLVADQVSTALARAPSVVSSFGVREPYWLSGPKAQDRMLVWQAIGRTSVALSLDADDALSLLRAHAFATDRDLDQVAADIVSGEVPTGALYGQ